MCIVIFLQLYMYMYMYCNKRQCGNNISIMYITMYVLTSLGSMHFNLYLYIYIYIGHIYKIY